MLALLLGTVIADKSKKASKAKKSKKSDKVVDFAAVQREHEATLEAVWKQHKESMTASKTATATAPTHALTLIEATEAKISKTKSDLALLEQKLAWLRASSAPGATPPVVVTAATSASATATSSCSAPASEIPAHTGSSVERMSSATSADTPTPSA